MKVVRTTSRHCQIKVVLISIILSLSAACQPTFVPPPSLAAKPSAQATARPTQTPRSIVLPSLTPTPPPLATPTPFPDSQNTLAPNSLVLPLPAPLGVTIVPTALIVSPLEVAPTSALIPTIPPLTTPGTPTATFVPTLLPAENTFRLGTSVQGRDILAWRFGSGPKTLLLVGGIHAGFESNTVLLVDQLIEHFESTPADMKPGITLILVPVLNPDGLALGRTTQGRFNANQVDLNRNWGCDWSEKSYWLNQMVNPGPRAFSEPETLALAQWIRTQRPAAAIFYHSNANGVFAGHCNGDNSSDALAAVLGEATGYPYGQPFSDYKVNGTESDWADGLGIPAVDLELSGTRDSESERNLRGVLAVECWLTGTQC